jgi:hypothetical protein
MPLKALLSACLLAAASVQAHHPGDPSASPATAPVLTAHLLEAGQISLGWSWQLAQYPLLSKQDLEAEVRAQGRALYVPEQASSQALELGVGATDWLQLGVALRSQRLERLREGHVHGDGSFGSHEMGSPSGLGNTELRAKARLARGEDWSLALLAGISLPTGQDDALTDGLRVDATANTSTGQLRSSPKYAYLGPAFQPGSGAVQGSLALAFSHEWGLWEGSASLAAQLPAAYKLYKPGNSGTVGLAFGRLFGEAGHERGWWGLELAGTQSEPSSFNGVGADDGGFGLAGGPSVRVPLGPKALGVLGATVPLALPKAQGPSPQAVFRLSLQAFF